MKIREDGFLIWTTYSRGKIQGRSRARYLTLCPRVLWSRSWAMPLAGATDYVRLVVLGEVVQSDSSGIKGRGTLVSASFRSGHDRSRCMSVCRCARHVVLMCAGWTSPLTGYYPCNNLNLILLQSTRITTQSVYLFDYKATRRFKLNAFDHRVTRRTRSRLALSQRHRRCISRP